MRVLLIALCLVSSPCWAQDGGDKCRDFSDVLAEASAAGVSIFPLLASAVGPFTMLYNAKPPPSNDVFDDAAVGLRPDGVADVLLLRDQRVCGHLSFPAEQWKALREAALGTMA